MDDRRRRLLPPMSALSAFESAARHQNFSRAGAELGLTQSAISRQIAVLEDWLQIPLFTRSGRVVQLTEEGQGYAELVAPALDRIRSATDAALTNGRDNELNIATLPSFGMRWLAPRLPRLTAKFPSLVINFSARSFPFEFSDNVFDAAVHYGLPDWPAAHHDLLFEEESILVCSPHRLDSSPIRDAKDVLQWPLLVQASRRDAWQQWFTAAGMSVDPPPPSASFEQFLMLAQAVIAGSGVALIPRFLIEPELRTKSLVSPLATLLRSKKAYYLVYPTARRGKRALESLRTWLLEEVSLPPEAG